MPDDPQARIEKARALAGSSDPDAIAQLMRLMEDPDPDVRNWATFFLGTKREDDTPEIRSALRSRLHDSLLDIHQEAYWGLAKRRDPEGIRLLLAQLESDVWAEGDEQTAAELLGMDETDPDVERLCAGLRNLLEEVE